MHNSHSLAAICKQLDDESTTSRHSFWAYRWHFKANYNVCFFTGDEIWDRDDQQQRCMRRSCRILTTKKKRVYRSQKWNITPLENQHKIHSTFYFLSTVPLKATYHTPSSSCAFAMRKFHSHLPNPKQTADHHSEDETKQSQNTNNNPQNKPKKHMIDAVCM